MLNHAFACLLVAILAVCLLTPVSRAAAADEELVDNPAYKSWSEHKVGSAVTYQSNTVIGAQTIKTEISQKLVELTPAKAVVEVSVKIDIPGAQAPPAQKTELAAKVKKSEATVGKLPEGMKGEMKEKGTEKIDVGGKSYTCKVVEFSGEQNGVKTQGKSWTSDQIPGTLVKMETTANVGGQDMKTTMAVTKIDKK
jgi:hypothetical protein